MLKRLGLSLDLKQQRFSVFRMSAMRSFHKVGVASDERSAKFSSTLYGEKKEASHG